MKYNLGVKEKISFMLVYVAPMSRDLTFLHLEESTSYEINWIVFNKMHKLKYSESKPHQPSAFFLASPLLEIEFR